jgi:hypothetical protein
VKRHGIEQVIARALLTDAVLERLLAAGQPTIYEGRLQWRSWSQPFANTTGPWGGIGGAAITTFQVTVAVDHAAQLVLVFAGLDLFAFGWTDATWFWAQVAGTSINTSALEGYGLTVLDRPLR